MKIDIDVRSALIGGGIALVATHSPLSDLSLFSYEGISLPYFAAGLAALGLFAAVGSRPTAMVDTATKAAQSLAELFPSRPSKTGGSGPTMAPGVWLSANIPAWKTLSSQQLEKALTIAFEKQVTTSVQRDAYVGLQAAFGFLRECSDPTQDPRWALKELARRMDARISGRSTPFEMEKFLIDCHTRVPSVSKDVEHYFQRPGYTVIHLLDDLKETREAVGVVASAEFLWLKHIDRNAWYALNGLGRKGVAMVEAAGTMAHYAATRIAGDELDRPEVLGAVQGLIDYLERHAMLPRESSNAP